MESPVRLEFLGDSFDIVKRSLLQWLAACGTWSAHPMFTEPVSDEEARAYEQLLGVPLLSKSVLTQRTDRDEYFKPVCRARTHVFLDPDTGVSLRVRRGETAPRYLFRTELATIASARRQHLTLVFDKSVPRGRETQALREKLRLFASDNLNGVAYVSHACFLLVAPDAALVQRALEHLRGESGLPQSRFVCRITRR